MKIGDKFTRNFIIDEPVYHGFMNLFNDRNPLHADEAFAKKRGFRAAVMHGNILNGFLSFFIGECLPEKNVIIHSREISFHKPVFLGDCLLLEATITETISAVNVVIFKYVFQNMDGVKIAKGKFQIGIIK